MSKDTVFNTIEDMVNWIVSNGDYYGARKFALSDRSDRVWDNKEVGTAWQESRDAVSDRLWQARYHNEDGKYSEDDLKVMENELNGFQKTMPSQHVETWYWLDEKTERGSWHGGKTIHLSEELGKMIAGIWTMVPSYRGSSYTKYSPQGLTIAGILKRLGQTDVSDKIETAKVARKLADEKRSRNYHRENVQKLAKQLIEEMQKGLDEGVEFPVHLSELVDLSEYMEE